MESGAVNLLHMLEKRVRALCEEGKFPEARQTAEAAVEKARGILKADDPGTVVELALSLEVKGDLMRQTGELEAARTAYLEALELLDGSGDFTELLGRISASIAVLYDQGGQFDEAKKFYERAILLFERLDPPALLDVADLKNNLAFIFEESGDDDTAESLFLDALKITNEQLGEGDPETAAICNNLGALYQKAGHFSQAREMHSMALDNRTRQLGEDHPDTAQSHGNLAVTLAEADHSGDARRHFEKAISIYEGHLEEHGEDFATVAANYLEFLEEVGDSKTAASLEKKVRRLTK